MKLFSKLYAIIALLIIGVGAEAIAATPPTIQSRYQAFSLITSTSAKLAWVNGNGAKRVVVATTNGGINWATVAANLNTTAEYTDVNGNWSTAPQVGSTGAYVVDVLSGTFRVTNLSNLSANSTYYIHVFEYNVGGSPYIAYNSNSSVNNPANFTTLMLAPVLANATNITDDAADFSWTDPNNPDAASYNMDIATDAQFNNLVLAQFNTTGFGLTVINFDPNTVYYVRLYAVNGPNTSAASNVITFKTLLAPPVITANGPITFCGSGSVDLSYTPVNGLTYQWYKDAAPIQGATTTPYTATAAGAYYVVATDNLNNTGTSNTITITINPLPAVAVANGSTICANNTATITPTAVAGIGFRYYDAATAGNLLFTGASYTTPALNLTTTYYVEAYNTTTMCAAATRTPVVITVNPLPANALVNGATICAGNTTTLTPTAVANINFKFYDAPTAGTLLFTGAAYTTPVLNANATYYVEAYNTVTGCVAAARTAVTVTVNPLPANAVAAGSTICANSTATITPNVVAGIGFRYYDALTAGTLLGTGASFTTPVLNANATYYVEAYNTTTMCIAAARTAVTITVNPLPANALVNGATICAGNTTTLTPTAVAGVSFRFYDAATAGNLLFTGAAYTTPVLNANTTYYVEAYNTTTMCIAAARTAAVVTVNPLPANALVNGATICAGTTTTLTPTAVAGISFRFYDAPTAGNLLFTGAAYTTPVLNANTTYYVEAYNTTTLCVALARTAVTVTVNPLPANAVAAGSTICANNTATITPNVVAGVGFRYYDALTAGTLLGTGASFTTPVLNANATYYVEAYNTTTMCIAAARTAVTITVNPLPANAVVNGATICANNTATLTPTAVAGVSFRFYDAATAGTLLFTGAAYTTPVLNANATYYVEAYNTTTMCIAAARTAVTVTVNPLPANALVNGTTICAGNTATLTPTAVAGISFRFYDAANAGTLLFTGAAYTTPVLNANATYYVEAYNTTTMCIAAARTAVTVTVNPLAVVNTHPLSQLVNTGDNVTFTVVAANASSYQWQESQDNGQTWNDINLATGTSYTITNVPASITGYQYRVVVTNNCNTVNSNAAVLTVIIGEPNTQATNINWNYWSRTEINFSWTRGNGTNVLVVAKQGTNGIVAPVDGMTYTANTVFGAGSNLGAGSYVVYDGPGTSVSVTGLIRNTDYVFQVFEYNGTGLSTNYNPNAGLNNPRTRKTSIKEGFNVNEELTHNFNGNFAVSEVSPNPVSSNFNFSISALDAQEASVELYSVTGELVYSRTLNLVAGENPVNVQLVSAGNFAAGVYSLRIRSGADFIDKKVVIVP